MAFGSISVDKITDSEGSVFSPSSALFRNRIINGDMRIDQRNAGAAVTASGYGVDRFNIANTTDGAFSAQQDSSAPAGFINSTKITTTTADASVTTTQLFIFRQMIEGTNIADLAWGTANAKTVTLSFWVRSSLTGTFGGSLLNSDSSRSYPFTYSISSADTWEQKSVTIDGETSGTWLTDTGVGIRVTFGLGVGPDRSGTAGAWNSNNNQSATGAVSVIGTLDATWYVTGVQLEVGSVATPFERRPFGTELALCQRYFEKSYDQGTTPGTNTFSGAYTFGGSSEGNGNSIIPISYSVKRAAPTLTGYLTAGTSGSWNYERNGASGTGTITFDQTSDRESRAYVAVGTNWVVTFVYGHWTASAEL
jgi:hypothetical protein